MAPIEVRTRLGAWWACGLGPVAGDPPRLLAVAADITERIETREALRETERRLFHAQKLEAIGRLSSGLAHDINNVLATVQAHTDLLGVRGGTDPDAARSLEDIRTSVGRASALTRRLLTAASRPRGTTPETTDLAGAVRGARATEAFYTTKSIGRGSGLGLSTVREVVEGAGGRLSIDSALGRGTTVCVALPRAQVGPPQVEGIASLRRGRGERVLLVEDDGDLRSTVAQMLAIVGYDVLTSPSAEGALETLESGATVDLVLTDAVMPGMGGLGLVNVLRARSPGLPIVLMSGLIELSDDLGMGPRPDAFLAKPFRLGELSATVGRLLAT